MCCTSKLSSGLTVPRDEAMQVKCDNRSGSKGERKEREMGSVWTDQEADGQCN